MNIFGLPAFKDNYIWILQHVSDDSFDCVDPGDAEPVLQYAKDNQLKLKAVYLTHHHYDHTNGVSALLNYFPNLKVFGPNDNSIPTITDNLANNDIVHNNHYSLKVMATPGHTASHISYFEENEHWLFCGDTLFSAGCGKVFDGSIKELFDSLNRIKKLPNDTKIYCAHEYTKNNLLFAQTVEPYNQDIKHYLRKLKEISSACSLPSTLTLEKKVNPFLRIGHQSIVDFSRQHNIDETNDLAVFTFLRQQKDLF